MSKVAIITGASSGIGQALAQRFNSEGYELVLTYNSNAKGIADTVSRLGVGAKSFIYKVDMRSENEISSFVEALKLKYKNVDLLINNAGVGNDTRPLVDQSYEEISDLMKSNIVGTIYLSQLIVTAFWGNQEKGCIINTSSIRGLEYAGNPSSLVYAASKAAMNSFTKTAAKLWAPNVLVNAIAPGFTRVERIEKFEDKVKKGFIEQTYLKRFVEVDEISNTFVFLSNNDAMTGQVIYVDAGFALK
jgi:3-oxoacyl-[acyl-carrier protein] reductase